MDLHSDAVLTAMPVGLPRPLYEGLPVPYTSEGDLAQERTPYANVSVISDQRAHHCRHNLLCGVCALPLSEQVLVYADESRYVLDGLALHGNCGALAVSQCPALHNGEQLEDYRPKDSTQQYTLTLTQYKQVVGWNRNPGTNNEYRLPPEATSDGLCSRGKDQAHRARQAVIKASRCPVIH